MIAASERERQIGTGSRSTAEESANTKGTDA